jgi:LPXTG-motif cell wall-anchored protein
MSKNTAKPTAKAKCWSALIVILTFLILLSSQSSKAEAATLHGTIYDLELNPLNNVIVTADTTPEQRYVSKDGKYSFTLNPGTYIIRAKYSQDNFTQLNSIEKVVINQEGDYIFDLFLMPDLEEDKEIYTDLEVESVSEVEEQTGMQNTTKFIIAVAITSMIFAVIVFYLKKRKKKAAQKKEKAQVLNKKTITEHKDIRTAQNAENKEEQNKEEQKQKSEKDETKEDKTEHTNEKKEEIEPDLQNILDFLKREGGRTTQKDLRREIPFSEAKISLMISELESKKKVRRIKKGRGNIIILNQ